MVMGGQESWVGEGFWGLWVFWFPPRLEQSYARKPQRWKRVKSRGRSQAWKMEKSVGPARVNVEALPDGTGMGNVWKPKPRTFPNTAETGSLQRWARKRGKTNRLLFCSLFKSNTSPEAPAPSCCQTLSPAWAPGTWARLIFKQGLWSLGSSLENRIKENGEHPWVSEIF